MNNKINKKQIWGNSNLKLNDWMWKTQLNNYTLITKIQFILFVVIHTQLVLWVTYVLLKSTNVKMRIHLQYNNVIYTSGGVRVVTRPNNNG